MRTYAIAELEASAADELEQLAFDAGSQCDLTRWLFASEGRSAEWHRRQAVARREELLQAIELSQLGS